MTHLQRLEDACSILKMLTGDTWNIEVASGSKFSIWRQGCGYLGRRSKVGAWKPTAVRLTWDEASNRLYNELRIQADYIDGMPEADRAREAMDLLCD